MHRSGCADVWVVFIDVWLRRHTDIDVIVADYMCKCRFKCVNV